MPCALLARYSSLLLLALAWLSSALLITRAQDPSFDGSMLRFRAWLASLIKGRRSSFSILANALTADAKLSAVQQQALNP